MPRRSNPRKTIDPSDWEKYWGDIINDYVIRGFGMSLDGGTVTIQTGEARIKGLYLKNDEEQTIDVSDGDYVGILITESSGEASSWNYATNSDASSLDMVLGRRDGTAIMDLRQSTKFATSNEVLYGDGSDGNVSINDDTMLTRDMQYNNLTIAEGVTVTVNLPSIMIRVKQEAIIRGRIVARGGALGGASGAANSHGIVGGHGYGQAGRGGSAKGGNNGQGARIINFEDSSEDDRHDLYPAGSNSTQRDGGNGGFHSYFNEGTTLEIVDGRNAILGASGGGGGAGGCSGDRSVVGAYFVRDENGDTLYVFYNEISDGGVAVSGGGVGGKGGSTVILIAQSLALYDTAEIDVRGVNGGDGVNDVEDGEDGTVDEDSYSPSGSNNNVVSASVSGGGGGAGSSGSGGGGCGGIVYLAYGELVEDGDIDVMVDGGDGGSLSTDSGGSGGSGTSVSGVSYGLSSTVSTSGESGNPDLTNVERRGVDGEDGEYILTRVST